MPHRDKKYEVNGHEIVLQQSEEGGSVVVWFDGYSGYIDRAMSHIDETPVSEKVTRHLEAGERWHAVKAMAAAMAELSVYFCKDCDSFYDSDKVKRRHFAGHRCEDCANSEKQCSENPESEAHDYEILNPHHRRNARIATRYKCQHCGKKKKSTPTG